MPRGPPEILYSCYSAEGGRGRVRDQAGFDKEATNCKGPKFLSLHNCVTMQRGISRDLGCFGSVVPNMPSEFCSSSGSGIAVQGWGRVVQVPPESMCLEALQCLVPHCLAIMLVRPDKPKPEIGCGFNGAFRSNFGSAVKLLKKWEKVEILQILRQM